MFVIIMFTATTVTIISNLPGTPVHGANNTFDYPVLSNLTLSCMVDPMPLVTVHYQWNTEGCYTNINYNNGVPRCFSKGKNTQNVTSNGLTAKDAGFISCTVTINGDKYRSESFTLRISGKWLVCVRYVHVTRFLMIVCKIHHNVSMYGRNVSRHFLYM